MATSHTKSSKLALTATSVFIGYLIKKMLKKGWKNQYDENPPGDVISERINWGKLILWTFLSGLLLRLIKVGIKRSLALVLKKQDLLVE